MDENVLQRLLALYATPQSNGPAPPQSMFMSPSPQGFALPTPQFNVQSSMSPRGGPPRFSGGVDVPAFGGTLGLSGEYEPPQGGPTDWSALLRYKRQF